MARLARAIVVLLVSALLALNVRSYFRTDVVGVLLADNLAMDVLSANGRIMLRTHVVGPNLRRQAGTWRRVSAPASYGACILSAPPTYTRPLIDRTLIYFADSGPGPSEPGRPASFIVIVPLWLLTLPWGLMLLRILFVWRTRTSRAEQGLCVTCGYDLRSSPDRCPECGTPSVV